MKTWKITLPIVLLVSPLLADEEPGPLSSYDPPLPPSFVEELRKADPAEGEKIFMRKCSSCHDHEKDGGNGKGPHLWNVMGRKAGTYPGFEYSDAMRNSGHTWNYATPPLRRKPQRISAASTGRPSPMRML